MLYNIKRNLRYFSISFIISFVFFFIIGLVETKSLKEAHHA